MSPLRLTQRYTTLKIYSRINNNYVKIKDIYFINSDNYEEGCGFFIDHYFITSGHVITECENPCIKISEEKICLTNPVFYEDNRRDPYGFDLAIFAVPGQNSELGLYEGEITPNLILTSKSFRCLDQEYLECKVTVNDYMECNYFGGRSSVNLKSGSSGSPIVIGNKVAGMMTRGNNDDRDIPMIPNLPLNLCIFLSAKSIRRLL